MRGLFLGECERSFVEERKAVHVFCGLGKGI